MNEANKPQRLPALSIRQAFQLNVIMEQRPHAITAAFNDAQVMEEVLTVLQENLAPDHGKLAGLFDSDNRVCKFC